MSRIFIFALLIVPVAACSERSGMGPDPLRMERYQLQYVDNNSLPIVVIDGFFDDRTELDSAFLVPYAIGRTIDRRLVNDRTGRGSGGGNTRDTTVARGQFMDLRVFRHVTPSLGTITYQRDSMLVDVEIRDTVLILRRDHPSAVQVRVDTGYFAGDLLVLNTAIEWILGQRYAPARPVTFSYRLTRY